VAGPDSIEIVLFQSFDILNHSSQTDNLTIIWIVIVSVLSEE